MATVTRARLREAVHKEIGLRVREAGELVETVIEAIAERLAEGETVMISGFGSFSVRYKGPRTGRNPRTGEAAEISPRRVVVFRPSRILRRRIADGAARLGVDGILALAPRMASSFSGRGWCGHSIRGRHGHHDPHPSSSLAALSGSRLAELPHPGERTAMRVYRDRVGSSPPGP